MTTVLGIETSCDECSASVVVHHPNLSGPARVEVASVATYSQIPIHRPYGGVVPEIASRNHLETVNQMIDQALSDAKIDPAALDAIAVTNRPGLVGALLVGVSAAKAMAYALKKPLIAVHHLEGHAASVFLDREPGDPASGMPLPGLLAIVSGGHTNLYVMKTLPELWPPDFLARALVGRSRDDAAGEAFDKTAKLLGFPYPGGAWIDKTAQKGGNPRAFAFPRALPRKATLDFSFSGLKTAVALAAEKLKTGGTLEERLPDFCASIQEAIVDALLTKIFLAVREHGCGFVAIVGGVAANSRLRSRLDAEWERAGLAIPPLFPKARYCTDNAAMIAAAGAFRFRQGHFLREQDALTLNAIANPELSPMSPATGKRRALGQHFLRDPHIIGLIVQTALDEARRHGCRSLLEIGPGRGALTLPLLDQLAQTPGLITRLILAERDRELAANWRVTALMVKEKRPELSVEEGDFGELPEARWLHSPPLAIASNLPYSAGTAILQRLARHHGGEIPFMVLMFQAEVAARLRAEAGTKAWGSLSIWVQNRWDVRKLCSVGPRAFAPPPEVDSEVVVLTRRPHPRVPFRADQEAQWEGLLKACFAHRRKMLRSGLASEAHRRALERAGIDPTLRAEALSWEQWERFMGQL